MKKESGRQSIKVEGNEWLFCRNGWQSTGVVITVELFDMLKEMVNTPEIVEYYESVRDSKH
ncbi:MAG: hypothetical protein GY951_18415 [Psychromonas sp.]|nr:hypothetical protein [Psychromonas sp.]